MASAERVFALLDTHEPDAPDFEPSSVPSPAPPRRPDAHVAFEEVTFGYRADAPVLAGVPLAPRRGENVAGVGSSGAGKSTIIRLLARLYEPTGGRILLGGRDVRGIPIAELRRRIVVVGQDPFLFAGTLRDKI